MTVSKALLQIALDFLSEEKALRIAGEVMEDVNILEAGTPLIKSVGMEIIRKLRQIAPNKIIVADMKTMDVGDLEARISFEAGADIMTVCGAGPIETIISAITEAKKWGRKVLVDTIGIGSSLLVAKAWVFEEVGADYIGIHTGIDQQAKGKTPLADLKLLYESGINVPLAVAGGIKLEHIPELLKYQPGIIIVGSAITKANDPKRAAREFKEKIMEGGK